MRLTSSAGGQGVEVGSHLGGLTVGRFLAEIAARNGDRAALVYEDREVSYRELDAASRRLARGLVGAGVVKGARIAVLLGNRPEWIEVFFAAGLVGAVLVPVNTFAKPGELDYVLRHSDASLLVLQPSLQGHRYLEDLIGRHPELGHGEPGRLYCNALPNLRRIVSVADGERPRGVQGIADLVSEGAAVSEDMLDRIREQVAPSDDGLIVYTSGTSALPKAVLHMQRAMLVNGLRFTEWMQLHEADRVFTAQPFFWTAGIAMSLVATLHAGACLLLEETFDAERSLEWIERQRATTIHAWQHQQQALAARAAARPRDLSAVRNLYATSPLAPYAPNIRRDWGLQGSYGLTETFTIVTTLPADAPQALRLESSGIPLPGNTVRIVDPESREAVPAGEPGEIAVKGFTLMRGYYKVEPEDCFDADGYFGTRDAGFIDAEGHLHWTGRISNMIKTGGANVSPLEIEAAAADFDALAIALAVGVPHPTLGEAIVLCVVPREGAGAFREEALFAHLRSRLASYKVPRRLLVFRPDELGYTGNQKIPYAPLRDLARRRLERDGVVIAGHAYDTSG